MCYRGWGFSKLKVSTLQSSMKIFNTTEFQNLLFKQGAYNDQAETTPLFKALPVGKSHTGLKPFMCYSISSARNCAQCYIVACAIIVQAHFRDFSIGAEHPVVMMLWETLDYQCNFPNRWAFIFTVGLIVGIPVFIIKYTPYRHTVHDGNRTRMSNEWPRMGGDGPNTQVFILFLLATLVQVCL